MSEINNNALPVDDAIQDGKKKRGGKMSRKVVALIVAIAIVLVGIPTGWALWNRFKNGDVAVSASDAAYVEINEKYTDQKITDGDSAIASLNDVANVLGIADVSSEFSVKSEKELDGAAFYRLSQVYNGIPVYGRSVVVIAQENGEALGLTSNYVNLQVDTTIKISEEVAQDIAKEVMINEFECNAEEVFVKAQDKVIYSIDTDTTSYVYVVLAFGTTSESQDVAKNIFIDVKDGTVVHTEDCFWYNTNASQPTVAKRQDGADCVVNLLKPESLDRYIAFDSQRNIFVKRAITTKKSDMLLGFIKWDDTFNVWDGDIESGNIDNSNYVSWNKNEEDRAAVDALYNISKVYDYFASDLFRHKGCDGKGETSIISVIGFQRYGVDEKNYGGFQAYLGDGVHALAFQDYDNSKKDENGNLKSMVDQLDLVGHEYTHGVTHWTAGLGGSTQAKAIGEAISDIFGVFVAYDDTNEMDWLRGRNLSAPDGANISSYYNFSESMCCHDASTVVSHAAYLMWNGGTTGEWAAISDAKMLAKMWYRALYIMHSNATFAQCRNAVELSARMMLANGELTEEQYHTVENAFIAVDIGNAPYQYKEYVKTQFDLTVLNSKGSNATSCNLVISKTSDIPSTNPRIVLTATVTNGIYKNIKLGIGDYIVTVSEKDKTPVSVRISVGMRDDATENVTIYTDFSSVITVILNRDEDEPDWEERYEPVLSQYREAIRNDFYKDVFDGTSEDDSVIGEYLNRELLSSARYGSGLTVYYAFYDVDENKIPELFIGSGYDTDHISECDIFTWSEGEIYRLAEAGYRGNIAAYDNGVISSTSGNALIRGWSFHKISADGHTLVLLDSLGKDDMLYFNGIDEDQQITKDEYDTIINKYTNQPISLIWKELTATTNQNSNVEQELRDMLKKTTSDPIYSFAYGDYDADGIYEAFVVTGTEGEWGIENCAVWFVSKVTGVMKLLDNPPGNPMDVIDTGKYKFFVWSKHAGGSGGVSLVYGVKDGRPYELLVSGNVDGFCKNQEGKYQAIRHDFSQGYHDFIPYYFYFDEGTREFYEEGTSSSSQVSQTTSPTAHSDLIKFGKYEWRVLEVQDGRALIVTEYIIGSRAYHESPGDQPTWETSDIRHWLNNEFYNSFTEAERNRIVQTTVINNSNPWYGRSGGNNTQDKIFLLSIEEVVRYFGDSGLLSNPPDYSYPEYSDQYNSARITTSGAGKSGLVWWLRSRGFSTVSFLYINGDGSFPPIGTTFGNKFGVRPALWINM